MRVDRRMLHPELQKVGMLAKMVYPSFTKRTYRITKVAVKWMKGKCRGPLSYEQVYLSRADGSLLRLCVYAPKTLKSGVPGLLWLHGGGYGLGIPEQDEGFIRRFVEASDTVVVSPDYRLSIDAPYPAALEDCYEALLWLKAHGEAYGMRTDQIMVGGESAGGGLTAAIALYARDRGEVALAFQMPLYPMLDDRMDTASAVENNAPIWNSRSNEAAWKLYLGSLYGSPEVPPYASPARAESLEHLPPACTFVGGVDPFRDETVSYVEKLQACGIPVAFRLFEGCFHGFDVICPGTKVAKEANLFLLDSFRYAVMHYFAAQPEKTDQ